MKNKLARQATGIRGILGRFFVFSLVLSGCAAVPSEQAPPQEMPGAVTSPLDYYQTLSRMTPVELGRERLALTALPFAANPNTQIRVAMLYGYSRTHQDISRALALLEGLLKSRNPEAIGLQPLVRLLADNYVERLRVEANLDRQALQLKESQRKLVELQEKIDSLADIERTLPQRPRGVRSLSSEKIR